MKRILMILVAAFCLSVAANAQQLQRANYNDGKIIAFIEQTTSTASGQRKKGDRLVIKNISSSPVTVDYQYKALRYDMNDNYQTEQVRHVTTPPIQPGQQWHEAGYISYNHLRGYYFVDAFAILNVSVQNNSAPKQNNTQQNVRQSNSASSTSTTTQSETLPAYLNGYWDGSSGAWYYINTQSNTMTKSSGDVADCVRIYRDRFIVKWRSNGSETTVFTNRSGYISVISRIGNGLFSNDYKKR